MHCITHGDPIHEAMAAAAAAARRHRMQTDRGLLSSEISTNYVNCCVETK